MSLKCYYTNRIHMKMKAVILWVIKLYLIFLDKWVYDTMKNKNAWTQKFTLGDIYYNLRCTKKRIQS